MRGQTESRLPHQAKTDLLGARNRRALGNGHVDTMLRRRIAKKRPCLICTQYFVDDVRLRRTFDLDIGNNQVRMLRYEDGGTNVQAISREYGL